MLFATRVFFPVYNFHECISMRLFFRLVYICAQQPFNTDTKNTCSFCFSMCVCLQLCILNCTQALTRQLNERNVPNEWNGFINSPIDIFSPHNISFEFNCSRETKNPGKNVQFYTVLGNELRVGVSRAIQYFLLSYTVSHIVNQLVMLSEAAVLTIPWYIPFSILHHFFFFLWQYYLMLYAGKKSTIHNYLCIQNDVNTI